MIIKTAVVEDGDELPCHRSNIIESTPGEKYSRPALRIWWVERNNRND